jgi:general stress protein 26
MITSRGDQLTARPLTLLEQDGTTLRFLVSKSAHWIPDVHPTGDVNAAFARPDESSYVSLSGRARVSTDDATIERLWNPAAAVYFDGRDDPDIAVLEVEVSAGEYWEGPSSKVAQAIDMVRLKVTGKTADDHGDVEVP